MNAGQLALDLPHRPAMDRADFLVADGNREAVAWLDRWPDWPAPALTVHGPAASGKTHLVQVWRAHVAGAGRTGRTGRTGRAGRAGEPAAPLLIAAAGLATAPPADLLGPATCCAIEDIDGPDGVVGDAGREQALFHLYNHLAASGGHLLLTALAPPARWSFALADLRSRLVAAPAIGLATPDEGLLGALLVKLFADRQLRVGDDLLTWLLARMERSPAAAARLVGRLDAAALADRRNITIPLARQVLAGENTED